MGWAVYFELVNYNQLSYGTSIVQNHPTGQ